MHMEAPSAELLAFFAGLPPPTLDGAPREITETPELQRIRDAERVDWMAPDQGHTIDDLVRALSARLRMPDGQQTLKPIQAAVLKALYERGSVYAPIRTAGGKTLISFLAAEVADAKRPLLLVPAKLINSGKTHREHARARQHWKLRPVLPARASKSRVLAATTYAPLRVVSYEALSRADYADALVNWMPDLIVMDECHKAKDVHAAVTKRLGRFIRQFQPRVVLLTGSPVNRRLGEYAHQLRWAMGSSAPVPSDWHELQAWGYALDEKVQEATRLSPGALLQLSPPALEEPDDARGQARQRFARRLRSTHGVVASGDDLPGVSLTASVQRLEPDAEMRAAVTHMREKWETPCGLPFEQATQLWAHEREVSAGFYYRWRVQPPPEWLMARRAWSAFVRYTLARSRTLDSPLAVANAVDIGKVDDGGTLAEWRQVEPMFRPKDHQEAVWISDQTLDFCAKWLAEVRGICWVQHVAFGERLSQMTGLPYFAKDGKCGKLAVDLHDGPMIASIAAINEGFNLHVYHHDNLVSTTPTTCRQNEQMISRTHRDEQTADEVTVTFLQTLEGDAKALDQARADAVHIEQTTAMPQRLSAATWPDE